MEQLAPNGLPIIMGALGLIGSAAAPLKDQIIKDAYAALKAKITEKFGAQHPKVETTLAEQERNPQAPAKPLEEALSEAEVDHDPEILQLAEALIQLAESRHPGSTGNLVGVINAKNVVVADTITGNMTFS